MHFSSLLATLFVFFFTFYSCDCGKLDAISLLFLKHEKELFKNLKLQTTRNVLSYKSIMLSSQKFQEAALDFKVKRAIERAFKRMPTAALSNLAEYQECNPKEHSKRQKLQNYFRRAIVSRVERAIFGKKATKNINLNVKLLARSSIPPTSPNSDDEESESRHSSQGSGSEEESEVFLIRSAESVGSSSDEQRNSTEVKRMDKREIDESESEIDESEIDDDESEIQFKADKSSNSPIELDEESLDSFREELEKTFLVKEKSPIQEIQFNDGNNGSSTSIRILIEDYDDSQSGDDDSTRSVRKNLLADFEKAYVSHGQDESKGEIIKIKSIDRESNQDDVEIVGCNSDGEIMSDQDNVEIMKYESDQDDVEIMKYQSDQDDVEIMKYDDSQESIEQGNFDHEIIDQESYQNDVEIMSHHESVDQESSFQESNDQEDSYQENGNQQSNDQESGNQQSNDNESSNQQIIDLENDSQESSNQQINYQENNGQKQIQNLDFESAKSISLESNIENSNPANHRSSKSFPFFHELFTIDDAKNAHSLSETPEKQHNSNSHEEYDLILNDPQMDSQMNMDFFSNSSSTIYEMNFANSPRKRVRFVNLYPEEESLNDSLELLADGERKGIRTQIIEDSFDSALPLEEWNVIQKNFIKTNYLKEFEKERKSRVPIIIENHQEKPETLSKGERLWRWIQSWKNCLCNPIENDAVLEY